MSEVTLLGLVAASFTTGSFVPQVVKSWRTRQTHDISLGTYLLLVVGNLLWLAYGLILRNPPLIVANIVTLTLALSILVLKIKHG